MPPSFVLPGLSTRGEGESCPLPREEALHAARVLRVRAGDAVVLIDGAGTRAEAIVEAVNRGGVVVRVGRLHRPNPPRPAVVLAAAPPKGGRVEGMVDQLAQLGVAAWVPLLTERGEPDGSANRRRRWERSAAEAAKQCGCADFLVVEPAVSPKRAVEARPPGSTRLWAIADPGGDPPSVPPGVDEVCVLVGPEGGFTPAELEAAVAAGAVRWRLGPHILRIETAAVAAAAAVRVLCGSG